MSTISFALVTPSGVRAREEASLIRAITPGGQIELLPGHCSYVGLVSEGALEVVLTPSGKVVSFSIAEGSLECKDDTVTVLTDSCSQ
jgi:F0F1-type ATP synthase epsilon subunit